MDQPDFWSFNRNLFVTSSVIGLTVSALISAGKSWLKYEEAKSIEFAAVLNVCVKLSVPLHHLAHLTYVPTFQNASTYLAIDKSLN